MPNLLQHYGIDWLAMALTLVAIWLLGDRRRSGFLVMMGGNTCWTVLAVLVGSAAMAIANLVFLTMNLRGYVRWSRADPPADPAGR